MNYARLAIAAIVGTVVDAVYGFIVYGTMLTADFGRFPGVFRPADVQAGYMPVLFAGTFVAVLAATYIYAKGYEGGSGLAEGVRFGVAVGLFTIGYVAVVNYAVLNIGGRLATLTGMASFVEWVVVGAAIGAVYRPAVRSSARVRSATV